ncbi:SiaB family protein kinase [Halothiobacillus sp. DCM-1]|uniref:SiaB family protein kinase n=1 Tax=Halothiobacillus sp. DCM-1 TaxID=3112558 RepID=UPI00324AC317
MNDAPDLQPPAITDSPCFPGLVEGLIFFYAGYFSQNIINAIGDAVRLRLEQSDAPGGVRRKIFSTFIEMAQNIVHYSSDMLTPPDQATLEMRAGSVMVMHTEGRFFITCANPVDAQYADKLKGILEPLRQMNADQIKDAYRKTLRAETDQDSKGAGLGFLTIAKDSSAPVEFHFAPNEHGLFMFTLKATI